MDLITVVNRYPDQETCIAHLESVRFGKHGAFCRYCGGTRVARKRENSRIGRWNCFDCSSSFNVLQGTIFQKTKIPLQKWFVAIALMISAKKSLSSHQMARSLGMSQRTAWYMMQRVRSGMASEERELLQDIIEVDETYVGGRVRWKEGDTTEYRGRGVNKVTVIGAVQRGGDVHAEVTEGVTGRDVMEFINRVSDVTTTTLITDQFPAYRIMDTIMRHLTISHSTRYVDGMVHTNTIEGFWSQLMRAWFGQHHHYSKTHMPLYIAEACWKYNKRREDPKDTFNEFLQGAVLAT